MTRMGMWAVAGVTFLPGVAHAAGGWEGAEAELALSGLLTLPLAAAVAWPFVRRRVGAACPASWIAGGAGWIVFLAAYLLGFQAANEWFHPLPSLLHLALIFVAPGLAGGAAGRLVLRLRYGMRLGPIATVAWGAAMMPLVFPWILLVDGLAGLAR